MAVGAGKGTGNFGESPSGGAKDDHPSLNVQGNRREHYVVANQQVIPTVERPGIYIPTSKASFCPLKCCAWSQGE